MADLGRMDRPHGIKYKRQNHNAEKGEDAQISPCESTSQENYK